MTILTALQRVHWEVYNSYIDQHYMFLVQIKGHEMRWRKWPQSKAFNLVTLNDLVCKLNLDISTDHIEHKKGRGNYTQSIAFTLVTLNDPGCNCDKIKLVSVDILCYWPSTVTHYVSYLSPSVKSEIDVTNVCISDQHFSCYTFGNSSSQEIATYLHKYGFVVFIFDIWSWNMPRDIHSAFMIV